MLKLPALFLLAPTLALADPSQASFAPHLGLAGNPGAVLVVSAKEPQPSDGDMKFWIAMDLVRSGHVVVRIERMVFAGGLTCEQADCVTGWLAGNRLDTGERLLVMSGKEITEIEFFVSDGAKFERFGTLEGPFKQCKSDAKAREEYADGKWGLSGWIAPSVARAPFPADPKDLVVTCVK